MALDLACCTWALSGPDDEVLTQLATAGFRWLDIRPGDFTAPSSRARMRELGLAVSCMGLSFGIPAGASLDSADPASRAAAVQAGTVALAGAAEAGAQTAYVIPGLDASRDSLARYAASLGALGDAAASYGIRLGIEHFPGRALPTVAGTLAFLDALNHPNVGLLLDIGHAQMSGEAFPAAIAAAGQRLVYVHLDDNDGVGDLHWALYAGVLTPAALAAAFTALTEHGYTGRASLELSPSLPDLLAALVASRAATLAAMR